MNEEIKRDLDLGDVYGFIRTIDFAPTAVPKRFTDQFVIVTAGASSRAYIYDTKPTGGLAWRYVVLT